MAGCVYAVGYAWAVMNRKAGTGVEKDRQCEYFSEKGDSGSAVFTTDNKFVGLLHAGMEYSREISLCHVGAGSGGGH
jgi:hypothetical protein